jgi:hypothetical protein
MEATNAKTASGALLDGARRNTRRTDGATLQQLLLAALAH